jgi:DNA-binding NtrC family response regulator
MGCFEVASGGTLFLDEIGELPLNVQTRLLRVLEDGKVTRVGESRLRDVDCRIVSATNRNITAEVQAGRFRTDLYYRLRVMDITLPPLRERIEDLAALCEHLLQPYVGGGGFRIHPEVFELFKKYRWPGNIRELRNTLERMAVMSRPQPGESTRASVTQLTLNDVPLDIRRAVEIGPILTDSGRMPAVAAEPASTIVTPPRGTSQSGDGFAVPHGQIRSLEQLQVEYARWVLEHFNGNKTKAAKALGIQRSTLYAWTEWEKE